MVDRINYFGCESNYFSIDYHDFCNYYLLSFNKRISVRSDFLVSYLDVVKMKCEPQGRRYHHHLMLITVLLLV